MARDAARGRAEILGCLWRGVVAFFEGVSGARRGVAGGARRSGWRGCGGWAEMRA